MSKEVDAVKGDVNMPDDFITRREHEQFERRLTTEWERRDDENHRQNKRLDKLEAAMNRIEGLTLAIEKMAVSINTMTDEIKSQGARLTAIEAKPAKRWESLVTDIIKLLVAAVVGFLLAKIGMP